MILFGTHAVPSTFSTGEFFCPHCEKRTSYEHKMLRKYFHVWYIPLIPLEFVGGYIECKKCGNTFSLEVISYNPKEETERFYADFKRILRRVMVYMILAEGNATNTEMQTIRSLYSGATGEEISKSDVELEVKQMRTSRSDVEIDLLDFERALSPIGKELLVKAAFHVAVADGPLVEREVALLNTIGDALGIPSNEMRNLLQRLFSP